MQRLGIDTHTHTIASGHAYSTIEENAAAAAAAGLEAVGITEHAPTLRGAPCDIYFMNMHVLDPVISGVRVLHGVELNILDYSGRYDGCMTRDILSRLDYAIASFHDMLLTPGSEKENTAAYLGAMDDPLVKIIGHPEDGRVPVDMEQLVLAAKATGTLLEVNNSSLRAAYYRLNTRENMINMLKLCEKHGVSVAVGTDAHYSSAVGRFDEARGVLDEVGFPQELLASESLEKFMRITGRKTA